ncbi:hypothetical protein LEP1GSC058_0852 [Leptospira fainei serovar Hurstbridge str. BUT 6]|uniref:Uncharacterized protein n=1 Tax=Leptospira fainei serovar Hurstbridge str. BUT 6 TaxID=1193011 RepID=S3UW93_9LEPT|nr:hypothetical protein LEP1GSC058_0852 [Leptospira fainei serovar Hurstbridge str. BUT 6]
MDEEIKDGASVYFIFFFINFLTLSPVSCSKDPDFIISICKSYSCYEQIN